ncbi:MAG: glycosyltransferase, partial [Cyanobacteria bacterium]|nr:glycosyltransferase [Cyanobacteriota bacterium]
GKPCHKIPNGFSLENFPGYLEDLPKPPCPPGFLKGEEKTFVYWGNILTDWVDEALLKAVAEAKPQWAFNMIGTMVDEHPKRLSLPNIRYHGELPVSALEAYGRHSDIGFINFKDNRLIRGVNPVKAFEYLASGLPIISTPMKEIEDFPNTLIVRTPEEFIQAVEILETQPLDHTHRRQFLKEATWSGRAQCFLEHMNEKAY